MERTYLRKMVDVDIRYGHDRKLCSLRPLLCCFMHVVMPFLLKYSCHISLFKCPVSSYPAPHSSSNQLDKSGFILFTPGVSSQELPTTPSPVCLLAAAM